MNEDTKVYVLCYVPENAFEQERIILGIFSSVEILKEQFYSYKSETTLLYNANNMEISTPDSDYFYYESFTINEIEE